MTVLLIVKGPACRLFLAVLMLAAWTAGGPAFAETPQIELPVLSGEVTPDAPLTEEVPPAGETRSDAARSEAAGSEAAGSESAEAEAAAPEEGLIQLPALSEAETPEADPATAEVPETVQAPVDRDRSEGSATASSGWIIRPRPAMLLPDGVKVGASFSAPGIVRLTGESAGLDLRLDLPATAALPDKLQLTFHSSVNVLPEQAVMQVVVNDAEPVAVPLDQLGGFTGVTVETAALVPGSNRIRLSLHQPHRIFCGPEATFGVWTELDLANSGVMVDDSALPADAAGFALAARSETGGGHNLLLLADDDTDPVLIRTIAAQLEQALGPGARVMRSSFYGLERSAIASVALIASDQPNVMVRRGAGRGLVLQVEYHDGKLPDLTPFLAAFPPAPPASAPAITPAQRTPLADLGSADVIGNTHYFRRDIPFALPADWLLMANQKARLDLHYGFARNLAQGAILLVKVNDETIRLLPLDQKGGEILPVLPVSFNANLLHPGQNTLSFEMMVPGNPPDSACPIRRADMLVVLNDSSLTIPPSPSMVLPGLAAVLMRLDPANVIAPPEASDQHRLAEEAMRIAAELAPPTEASAEVRLQIVGLSDLALVPLEETGLSMSAVQRVLFPMHSQVGEDAGAATAAAGLKGADQTTEPVATAFSLVEADDPVAQKASVEREDPAAHPGIVAAIWENLSPGTILSREYDRFRDSAFVGTSESLPDWLEGRRGDALLLRPIYAERSELWLILGPGAAPDAVGEALNRLRVASEAQGEAALLQADGSWQVWTPIRPPRLLTMPDAQEMRTALGNYASWSPLLFTVMMLGLALLSAVPALLYVLLSRRGKEAR